MQRFDETQKDEEWKERNCKVCPNCARLVNKLDGCDSMTCGRDAPDKGGGNAQDGCGATFNWSAAPQYKRKASDTARLPKTLADIDPTLASEVKHHIMAVADGGTTAGVIMRADSSDFRLKCSHCAHEIVGPLFRCIHCRDFSVCIDCSVLDPDLLGSKQAALLFNSSLEDDHVLDLMLKGGKHPATRNTSLSS